ncbi:MAG: TIR domain-containing protein, partial [Chloroflexota bacterium]|nr:TIR domain-containing protein [Chloroflexota bacterium]
MSDAFISYRRDPSFPTAQLVQTTLDVKHGLDSYLDVTRSDGARVQFPDRLLAAIADGRVFICLLADTTLDSEWVLKEIRHAHSLRKPCIPVFQENWQPYTGDEAAVAYLLDFNGVHILERRGLYVTEAIDKIAAIIKATPDLTPPASVPAPAPTPVPQPARRSTLPLVTAGIALALVVGLLIILPRLTSGGAPTPTPPILTQTGNAAAPLDLPTATEAPALVDPTRAPIPLGEAGNPVTSNAQWTAREQDFGGVAMVRVPAGCFTIGSDSGGSDERNGNE